MNRHRKKSGKSRLSGRLANPRNLIIASQGVYSVNNLAFTLLVAHFGGIADVGQSAIYASVTAVCLGLSRALFVEPMLLSKRAELQTDYLILVTIFAFTLCTASFLVSVSLDVNVRTALVLAGGFIVIQDYVRQVNFAKAKPARTLAMDLYWLLSLVAYGLNGLLADGASVFRAWSAASLSSLLIGILLAGFVRPTSGGVGRVKNSSSGLVAYSVLEALTFQLIFNFGIVMAFSLFSIEAAGYYRLSSSVLAPVGLVMVALATANFVSISRGVSHISTLVRMSLTAGAVTLAVASCCIFALSLLQFSGVNLIAGVSLVYTSILAMQYPFYSASGPWSAYLKSSKARWDIVAARIAGVPTLAAVGGLAFIFDEMAMLYIAIALSASVQYSVDVFLSKRRFKLDRVAETDAFDRAPGSAAVRG